MGIFSKIIGFIKNPKNKLKYLSFEREQKRTAKRYRDLDKGIYYTDNEKRLLELQNKHQGKRCFIIGNGPSLNHLDLTLLKNEFTFGVNAIYTNYDKMGFYPSFYVVEDIFVAEDRAPEINAYNHGPKFFGNYLKYCLTDNPDTYWMNVVLYGQYKDFPRFSEFAAKEIYAGGTVSYLCMQLAFYLGFTEVYLIGFDHSYKIPKEALLKGTSITSTGDDPNHFKPDYFGKGKRWHDPQVDRMEEAYKKAKLHYENNGRKVYNATFGGHLEVFERKDYKSLFNQ